ncbi:MAG: DUF6056 family protein [Bacilli bacterium]|nr:DUF6056 family protein [Bacilli bacterium]
MIELINKNKNSLNNNKILYLLLFVGVFILHIFFKFSRDDITYFSKILDKMSLISYLDMRYRTWTSRIIIETILVVVTKYIYLWRILDSFIILLLIYSINKLCFKEADKNNILLVLLITFLYPLIDLTGAGFASCTTNYLWPLSFMLFSFIPYRKYYFKENIDKRMWPLYIMALIYASNQEQCVFLILAINMIFLVINIKNKNNWKYPLIGIIIAIVSIIFIITCPGNSLRNISEINTWYPDYVNANIMDKIYLAIVSSVSILISNGIVMCLFSLILFIGLVKTKTKIYNILFGLLLLVVMSILFVLRFVSIISNNKYIIFDYTTKVGHVFKNSLNNYIILCLCLLLFICIFYLLYIVLKEKSIIPIFIILLGCGTRLIMGFSPTIFASGRRTVIFLYFSLIIVIIYLLKNICNKLKILEKNILNIIILLCLIVNISFLFLKM